MTKICKKCDKDFDEEHKYCDECGSKLENKKVKEGDKKQEKAAISIKSPEYDGNTAIILFIIAAISLFYYFKSGWYWAIVSGEGASYLILAIFAASLGLRYRKK